MRGFNLPRPSNSSDFADIELNTNNGMVGSYYFKVDQGSVSQPARSKQMCDGLKIFPKLDGFTLCNWQMIFPLSPFNTFKGL